MKIAELEYYLQTGIGMSKRAARRRCLRIESFLESLASPVDYAICRFRYWQETGWRCAVFEKDWVFAYEVFDGGVIVRDMSHVRRLSE
ncbi:MAG: hypothetical protein LBL81_03685 [Tannerella sp.]|nr:hypothetical protein [Tannerella sp.]